MSASSSQQVRTCLRGPCRIKLPSRETPRSRLSTLTGPESSLSRWLSRRGRQREKLGETLTYVAQHSSQIGSRWSALFASVGLSMRATLRLGQGSLARLVQATIPKLCRLAWRSMGHSSSIRGVPLPLMMTASSCPTLSSAVVLCTSLKAREPAQQDLVLRRCASRDHHSARQDLRSANDAETRT